MRSYYGGISTKQVLSLGVLLVGMVGALAYFFQDEIYNLASRASNKTASLTIDVTQIQGKVRNTWGHVAQGGEDTRVNMLAPVERQLGKMAPETVRLDHIYDGYGVVERVDGRLVFNWTRLDEVVRTITAAGATPMFALSYMPSAISKGDVTDEPNDWNEWSLVVQRTVEHYSGDMKLSNVAYEVWNEPDLFGGFKTYGDKNYLTMYGYAVAGAERARGVRPFEIGGPAITAYYPAWMENLLKYVVEKNVRMDFVSWHKYSTNMDEYDRDLRQMALLLGTYRNQLPKGLKIYLTETGPDSENNPAYDLQSGAAHLVALAATTYDRLARVYAFELVDGKDPAGALKWGRWGMLTHPDVGILEKPRYQAFLWLNRLSGWRILVGGQGSWVKALATKHQADGYQVLIVNYDGYGTHSERVPLTITGLEPGRYTLDKEFFGKGKSQEIVEAGGGTYTTEVGLDVNQMVFLELVKRR